MKLLRIISLLIVIVFGIVMLNSVQVIYPTINAVQPPVPSGANSSAYASLQALHLRQMVGQTVIVGFGNSNNNPLYIDSENTANVACNPSANTNYTILDAAILLYATNIIWSPVTEGGTNTFTPICVWSQAQADASYLAYSATSYLPGDYVLQNSSYWIASCPTATLYDATCTAAGGGAFSTSPFTDGNVTWTNNGSHAPLQAGYCGPSYKCGPTGNSCYDTVGAVVITSANAVSTGCTLNELYESEAIPWMPPIRAYMKSILALAMARYYNKVNYMRVGFAGGELSPIGIDSGLWPYYGNTHNQRRAWYLSAVKQLDDYLVTLNLPPTMLHDMNCAGNPNDCAFADQDAQLAHDHNFGLDTNGYELDDISNITNAVGAPTPCSFNPMVAAQHCTAGDWLYNCSRFPTMQNGNPMWCSLQTFSASNPNGCIAGTTGSLAALPATATTCPNGFVGLIPFLVTLRTTGVPGVSPAVVVNVNNLELYTSDTNTSGSVAAGTYGASDMLLALYPNYSSTTNAQSAFVQYAPAYQQAFNMYLGIVPRLTLVGVGE